MEKELVGYIHSTENFSTVDGPGVRFVVFMQGCRMRCEFCHNPDTWDLKTDKMRAVTAKDLLREIDHFKAYWGAEGGITVSGGEPLLQLDFLLDLFTLAKSVGIQTALDTCGQPFTREEPFFSKINQIMAVTDLVLLDLKEINDERHRKLTGHSNVNILDFANYLSEIKQPVWIRHVLVPERSDFDEDLLSLNQFIKTVSNVQKVEVLPYHTMGEFKWKELGYRYPLAGIETPTIERVDNANKLLNTNDYGRLAVS